MDKNIPVCFGAIAGDVIGSRFEHNRPKRPNFTLVKSTCFFTDDTVLTIAVAAALLQGGDYGKFIREYALLYPNAGFGSYFWRWMASENPQPYNSFGNGSAMRVSPVAWAFNSIEDVLRESERTAVVTHNHPEGIKGAQAVALAIYLARTGVQKADIKSEIEQRFGYDLSRRLDDIRPAYRWDSTCPGSVPESIVSFLDGDNFESAIRNAINLGGDADTMAAIAGSIAEAYYGIPSEIVNAVREHIPAEFSSVLDEFIQTYLPSRQGHSDKLP